MDNYKGVFGFLSIPLWRVLYITILYRPEDNMMNNLKPEEKAMTQVDYSLVNRGLGGSLENWPLDTDYYHVSTKTKGIVSPIFDTPEEAKKWRDENQGRFDEQLDCWKGMIFS